MLIISCSNALLPDSSIVLSGNFSDLEKKPNGYVVRFEDGGTFASLKAIVSLPAHQSAAVPWLDIEEYSTFKMFQYYIVDELLEMVLIECDTEYFDNYRYRITVTYK